MSRRLITICITVILTGQTWGQIDIPRSANTSKSILDELGEDSFSDPDDFDTFLINNEKEFYAFLDSIDADYARFLEKEWLSVPLGGVVDKEKDKEIKPIIRKKGDDKKEEGRAIQGEIIPIIKDSKPQPQPIKPIEENQLNNEYNSFNFYGTIFNVRWSDAPKFKLSNLSNNEIARGYRVFSDEKYKNLLFDCLKLRKEYNLCDWAYYKVLEKMSEAACGIGSNEAVLLKGVLFNHSGYKMRFATNPKTKRLHLLCSIVGNAYEYPQYTIDGKAFYLFEKTKLPNLNYCPKEYKGEQDMSLAINTLPNLDVLLSKKKTIQASSYPIVVSSRVNKNLIDFFDEYPTSYSNNDVMTRWAYYANTPVSDEVKKAVYPVLKEKIADMPEEKAVNMLLDWVQPPYNDGKKMEEGLQIGFPYLLDDKEWGYDRAFFAEETLFYPGSDCEDHAILFSHLVRDLLGLDVILVFYDGDPGHLATAVCFNKDVRGDYIMVGNRKFTIADPTYTGAPAGETMPQCQNMKTKYILCNR